MVDCHLKTVDSPTFKLVLSAVNVTRGFKLPGVIFGLITTDIFPNDGSILFPISVGPVNVVPLVINLPLVYSTFPLDKNEINAYLAGLLLSYCPLVTPTVIVSGSSNAYTVALVFSVKLSSRNEYMNNLDIK